MSNYTTRDLVQYDEQGNLSKAVLKAMATWNDIPILVVSIRPPVGSMVESLDLPSTEPAKRQLIYRKVTRPTLYTNGRVYEAYTYELDLAHAASTLGYVLK